MSTNRPAPALLGALLNVFTAADGVPGMAGGEIACAHVCQQGVWIDGRESGDGTGSAADPAGAAATITPAPLPLFLIGAALVMVVRLRRRTARASVVLPVPVLP